MEKELIKSITALCSEASQASTTLKNLSTWLTMNQLCRQRSSLKIYCWT
jgi:hypothetical protein